MTGGAITAHCSNLHHAYVYMEDAVRLKIILNRKFELTKIQGYIRL